MLLGWPKVVRGIEFSAGLKFARALLGCLFIWIYTCFPVKVYGIV